MGLGDNVVNTVLHKKSIIFTVKEDIHSGRVKISKDDICIFHKYEDNSSKGFIIYNKVNGMYVYKTTVRVGHNIDIINYFNKVYLSDTDLIVNKDFYSELTLDEGLLFDIVIGGMDKVFNLDIMDKRVVSIDKSKNSFVIMIKKGDILSYSFNGLISREMSRETKIYLRTLSPKLVLRDNDDIFPIYLGDIIRYIEPCKISGE